MSNGADATDLPGHFRTAYQTVVRFPLLVAPPVVVGLLAFVLLFFIGGGAAMMGAAMGAMMGGGQGMAAGGVAGLLLGVLLFGLVMAFLGLLSSCVVVVMAPEALAGREPRLGDAVSAVMGRLGPVIGASALVTVIVTAGFFLFVLPGLVAVVLLIFTLPAVLLDGQGPVEGVKRSVALVRAYPGPVVGLVIGGILVLVAAGLASWIVGGVPLLGPLASFVLHSAAVSYLTVAGVGVYRALAGP
jgi:hypothetical protein